MAMPKGWPLSLRWLPSPLGERLHATSEDNGHNGLEAFCGVPVRVPIEAVLDSAGRKCRRCAHLINVRAKSWARQHPLSSRPGEPTASAGGGDA